MPGGGARSTREINYGNVLSACATLEGRAFERGNERMKHFPSSLSAVLLLDIPVSFSHNILDNFSQCLGSATSEN